MGKCGSKPRTPTKEKAADSTPPEASPTSDSETNKDPHQEGQASPPTASPEAVKSEHELTKQRSTTSIALGVGSATEIAKLSPDSSDAAAETKAKIEQSADTDNNLVHVHHQPKSDYSESEVEFETLVPAPVASGYPTIAETEEPVNADILKQVRSRSGNLKPKVRESIASTSLSLVIRKPPSTTCKSNSFWQRYFGWGNTADCYCSCPMTCDQYDVVLQTPTTLGCTSPCAYNSCCCPCPTNACACTGNGSPSSKKDAAAMTAECGCGVPQVCKPEPVEQTKEIVPYVPPVEPKPEEPRKSSSTKNNTLRRPDRFTRIQREPASGRYSRPSWQQQAPPPVFISSSGSGGNDGKRTLAGLEKLKNVDIVEELTYCVPTGCGCCCSNGCCCPQCVTCGRCGRGEGCCCCVDGCQPMGPIKYCRRQRFHFNERRDSDEEARKRGNDKSNPFDEIPVGKNPTPSALLNKSIAGTGTASVDGIPIEDVLPAESGTYYFNADQGSFAPVEEVGVNKKPPYIVEEVIEQEPVLTKIEPVITTERHDQNTVTLKKKTSKPKSDK